jgi:hypothetical protein
MGILPAGNKGWLVHEVKNGKCVLTIREEQQEFFLKFTVIGIIAKSRSRDLQEMPITASNELVSVF